MESSSGNTGSAACDDEMAPVRPNTVELPVRVYLIWLPGPPATVAEVRFWGEGEKVPGWVRISLFQLPGAR